MTEPNRGPFLCPVCDRPSYMASEIREGPRGVRVMWQCVSCLHWLMKREDPRNDGVPADDLRTCSGPGGPGQFAFADHTNAVEPRTCIELLGGGAWNGGPRGSFFSEADAVLWVATGATPRPSQPEQ